MTPTVSVIMPCRNYGRYLRESVESVLNQTFDDFEMLQVSPNQFGEVALFVGSYLRALRYPGRRSTALARLAAIPFTPWIARRYLRKHTTAGV